MNILDSVDILFMATDGKTYQEWLNSYMSQNQQGRPWTYGGLGFFCFVDLEEFS